MGEDEAVPSASLSTSPMSRVSTWRTHSRESSGASSSVKFVKNHGHTRNFSEDSHVIILTASEDLSEDEDIDHEKEDDEFSQKVDHELHEVNNNEEEEMDEINNALTDVDVVVDDHTLKTMAGSETGSAKSRGLVTTATIYGSTLVTDGNEGTTGTNSEPGPSSPASRPTGEHSSQSPLLPGDEAVVHDSCSSDDDEGATNSSGYVRRKSRHPRGTVAIRIDDDDDDECETGDDNEYFPLDIGRTMASFIFLVFGWIATVTALSLTHERVPNTTALPDVFLDNVDYQHWGLDASEVIIMVAFVLAFFVCLIHQHRWIVLRRVFFLVGIHYYYRAITMYVTVLPKADPTYMCAPKLDHVTVVVVIQRVIKLLSGLGLSIYGKHVYCGDYIYSGHTMALLMTFLVIKEYSPKRWFLLHWFSLVLTVAGVLTLLASRSHYSIDVILAYWFTTRVWWMYHTVANHSMLLTSDNQRVNHLSNLWWWHMVRYFESSVAGRQLPKRYNIPLPNAIQRLWTNRVNLRRSGSQNEGLQENIRNSHS